MNPANKLLGLRVVRGPDWNQGSLDGEEGGVGTIVSVDIGQNGRPLPDKSVLVYWDAGSAVVCRIGLSDCYDLRVYDSAPAGVLHSQFTCDECHQAGIAGMRWHCSECHDFDLCSDCYMDDRHHKDHNFVRFDKSNNRTDGTLLEGRLNADKVQARGIFPGAIVRRGEHLVLDSDLGSTVGQVVVFICLEGKARSAVMVQWSDGRESIHRVGYEGKVDLEQVDCADGPSYYKEHLPVVEYQLTDTSSELNVGDQVRLNHDHETVKEMTRQSKGWQANGYHSLAQVGTVIKIDEADKVQVAYGPVWIFHRNLLEKVPKLKVQDDVKDISQCLERLFNAFQDPANSELQMILDIIKEEPVIQVRDENVHDLINSQGVLEEEKLLEQDQPEMTESKEEAEVPVHDIKQDTECQLNILQDEVKEEN